MVSHIGAPRPLLPSSAELSSSHTQGSSCRFSNKSPKYRENVGECIAPNSSKPLVLNVIKRTQPKKTGAASPDVPKAPRAQHLKPDAPLTAPQARPEGRQLIAAALDSQFSMLASLCAFPRALTVSNGFLQLVEGDVVREGLSTTQRSSSCPGSLWCEETCPQSPGSVWSTASPSVMESFPDFDLGGGDHIAGAIALIARALQPAATEDSTAAPDDGELGSAEFPSVGSVGHKLGLCKPCVFLHADAGCANGVDCTFCHSCEPGERKRRQRAKLDKRKRQRAYKEARLASDVK